jgi:integrase
MRAEDVDLGEGVAVLAEHKTAHQTGRDRLLLLPDEAVSILRTVIAGRGRGLLFPGQRGQRLFANNISCRMRRLCERAGARCFAYGYRHTFATDALASGVPDAQVSALLGHSSTTMLHKHHSHLTSRTQVLRQALGRVRA